MMGTSHDHRSYVRGFLLAAAVLGLSLSAHAVAVRGHDVRTGQAVWDAAVNGKTTVIGNGNGGVSVMAPYKPSTVNASGNVDLKTGPTNAPVNGVNVPVSVNGTVNKGDIANAAVAAAGCAVGGGGAVGAVVCGGVALAIPIALNWMANAGVRVNPASKELEVMDKSKGSPSDGFKWQLSGGPTVLIYPSPDAACAAYVAHLQAQLPTWGPWTQTECTPTVSGGVKATGQNNPNSNKTLSQTVAKTGQSNNCPPPNYVSAAGSCITEASMWKGASVADATGLMNNSRIPSADIVKELDAAGQASKMPVQDPQVTGPASLQGPSTTSVTNNSTTNTTTNTTTTTNNYTYNNNTVTNNSSSSVTTTTTAVKNPDGTTTTTTGPTTTTTTNPGETTPVKEEEDPPTQCDKFPNSLGCAELDTPTGTIPKETKTVTFQAEDVLGGGQCPADVMTTLSTLNGQSVKVIDWQTFCGMALPLRALVIALASIMAFFIIMPGGVRE